MWRILFTLKGRDSVVLNFDVVIEDVWFWFGLDQRQRPLCLRRLQVALVQSYLTELFPGLKSKFRMDVTPPSPSRYMVIGDNADLFQEL